MCESEYELPDDIVGASLADTPQQAPAIRRIQLQPGERVILEALSEGDEPLSDADAGGLFAFMDGMNDDKLLPLVIVDGDLNLFAPEFEVDTDRNPDDDEPEPDDGEPLPVPERRAA
jgi:hypothetical protein